MIKISSNFDGGNIKCISDSNAQDIQLEIKKDYLSDFYQWFYFRLSGAPESGLYNKYHQRRRRSLSGGMEIVSGRCLL